MKQIGVLLIALLLIPALSLAQKKVSLSGYIKDGSTGEDMISANVYVKELGTGVATNIYGFYSISLVPGNYTIEVSYLGFNTITEQLTISQNTKKNYKLQPQQITTDEVVITAEKSDKNVKSNEMSKIDLEPEKLREIPVLFGETDIIKTIQLLPGIQSTGDGNSGFYVRGGGPDQNLILLDEAVVYNASHLFGF
ncbi:MAG: carboxypeptidase-like regulatory domain-containing protein, partial [Bacteroidia bacterium]